MSSELTIVIAIFFLLNSITGIIIAFEDKYLLRKDKFKYFILIIFLPILGSLFVLIRFGAKGNFQSSPNSHSNYNSDVHSTGGGGSSFGGD